MQITDVVTWRVQSWKCKCQVMWKLAVWRGSDECRLMGSCHNDETSPVWANRFIHFYLADCNGIWSHPADQWASAESSSHKKCPLKWIEREFFFWS